MNTVSPKDQCALEVGKGTSHQHLVCGDIDGTFFGFNDSSEQDVTMLHEERNERLREKVDKRMARQAELESQREQIERDKANAAKEKRQCVERVAEKKAAEAGKLKKKIELKKGETRRRHEESLTQVRQRAVELSSSRASENVANLADFSQIPSESGYSSCADSDSNGAFIKKCTLCEQTGKMEDGNTAVKVFYLSSNRPSNENYSQWMFLPIFSGSNNNEESPRAFLHAHVPTLNMMVLTQSLQAQVVHAQMLQSISRPFSPFVQSAPLRESAKRPLPSVSSHLTPPLTQSPPLKKSLKTAASATALVTEIAPLSSEQISGAKDLISANKEQISGNKDLISGTRKQISGNEDLISGTKEQMSGNKDLISRTKDLFSGSKEEISGTKEEISETKEEISENGNDGTAKRDGRIQVVPSVSLNTSRKGRKPLLPEKFGLPGVTCATCRRTYKTSTLLYYHNRQVHDVRKVVCEVCEKPLRNRIAYLKHRKGHFGAVELTHVCGVCHAGFPHSRNLVLHCRATLHDFQASTDYMSSAQDVRSEHGEREMDEKCADDGAFGGDDGDDPPGPDSVGEIVFNNAMAGGGKKLCPEEVNR